MVEKLFRTRLCVLYQRGRCGRQNCSFAHGEAELRRHSGSNGRRDNRVVDLRDRLDRRRSPLHRLSPKRDARAGQTLHGQDLPRDMKRRKYGRRRHFDGGGDLPGTLGATNGPEDGNLTSTGSRDILEDQLRQVHSDLNLLTDKRYGLEAELEERTQEADSLSSRIEDLEFQLSEERENSRRITSKIKKFLRAHNNCNQQQEVLKRSQSRLNKLAEELSLDTVPVAGNEDSSINIVSDAKTAINHVANQASEPKKISDSSAKKKSHTKLDADAEEGSKSVKLGKRARVVSEEGTSFRDPHYVRYGGDREAAVVNKRKDTARLHPREGKPKRRKDVPRTAVSSDKLESLWPNSLVPSTSMAAHAVDELADMTEAEERAVAAKTTSERVENGAALGTEMYSVPLPPPPPLPNNNDTQDVGDHLELYADGGDEDLDADIV